MKSLLATTALATLLATVAPAAAFDWNGGYAGVVVGYASGNADVHYDADVNGVLDFSMAPAGWLGGATLGYNAALGNGVVIGVEGDLSLANITDTVDDNTNPPPDTITSLTDWTGSMRGRVGFDAGEVMPFLTAGVAFAHATASATDGDISDSAVLFGYTIGGGVEVAVTDSVTLKGEYLYTDLGSHTWFSGESYANTSAQTSHAIRGGINFHF